MKSLLLALAVTCLCPVQKCEAITDAALGRWKAKLTNVYRNQRIPATGTTIVKRFETAGVYMKSTVKVAGQPAGTSHTWFSDSGDLYGELVQGGIVIGSMTGTWTEEGNRVSYTAQVSSLYIDYTATASFTVKNRKRIDTTSRSSNGLRGAGVLTRK